MKQITNMLSKLYTTNKGRWAAGFITSLLFLCVLFLARPIFFYIHDINMMKTYSGIRTGVITAEHIYGNMYWGILMSTLYKITQTVPWYSIITLIIISISLATIFRSLLTLSFFRNLNPLFPAITFAVISITALIYPLTTIIFTTNAALVIGASLSLIFTVSVNSRKAKYFDFSLSGFLLVLASIIRFSSFKAGVSFWVLALCLVYIGESGSFFKEKQIVSRQLFIKKTRTYLLYFLSVLLVCVLGNITNDRLHIDTSPEGTDEYNEKRIDFYDYPTLDYDDAPEFYTSIGWTKALYELAKDSYFIDDRFNNENLDAIIAFSKSSDLRLFSLENTLSLAKDTMITDKSGLALSLTLLTEALIIVFYIIKKTRAKSHFCSFLISGLLSVIITLVLSFYLCSKGRFPLRAYQSIALPAILMICFSIIAAIHADNKDNKHSNNNSLLYKRMQLLVLLNTFFSFIFAVGFFSLPKISEKLLSQDSKWIAIVGDFRVAFFIISGLFIVLAFRLLKWYFNDFHVYNNNHRSVFKTMFSLGVAALLSGTLIFAMSNSINNVFDQTDIQKKLDSNLLHEDLVEYASEHREQIIIVGSLNADYRFFIDATKELEINILYWGGTNAFTFNNSERLQKLGITKFDNEIFFNNSVYYATKENENVNTSYLLQLLREKHPCAVPIYITSTQNGVVVYKITDGGIEGFEKSEIKRYLADIGITDELLGGIDIKKNSSFDFESFRRLLLGINEKFNITLSFSDFQNESYNSINSIVELIYRKEQIIAEEKRIYREKIIEMLRLVNPNIDYLNNDNLIKDNLYSYSDVFRIVIALNNTFDVEIATDDVTEEHFNSLDRIVDFVYYLKNEKGR
ncbi:MAG: hypothetical protein LBQ95_01620 [Lachnospiraceae bacterium]|jgi:acyl carrier protein|nr:hypothetical protein [Lachnospiraceae bacterium]